MVQIYIVGSKESGSIIHWPLYQFPECRRSQKDTSTWYVLIFSSYFQIFRHFLPVGTIMEFHPIHSRMCRCFWEQPLVSWKISCPKPLTWAVYKTVLFRHRIKQFLSYSKFITVHIILLYRQTGISSIPISSIIWQCVDFCLVRVWTFLLIRFLFHGGRDGL